MLPAALEPLEVAAASGLFVFILRHDRKSGGDVGDSGRGSSAWSGAADIVLQLRRCDAPGHENRRTLLGVGRFEEVPAQVVIEFADGSYTDLGDSTRVEVRECMAKLLDVLPAAETAPGLTETELMEKTGAARSTFKRAIADLIDDGKAAKHSGAGKTGRAFGYTLAEESK